MMFRVAMPGSEPRPGPGGGRGLDPLARTLARRGLHSACNSESDRPKSDRPV
jgi:hypothetical protein